MNKKRLFLLDVMPLLYRAHFATLGKHFGTTTGIDTRTTLVFFNYIFQILLEERPDGIIAALDSKAKERVALSADYKTNRDKMPEEIYEAFPYALRLLEVLAIPVVKIEGQEADDVLASIANEGIKRDYDVFIVSPDKDFAQLVSDRVFLYRPAYKGVTMETLDEGGVVEKYGVVPGQIADFLALRGDSVDNILGVKGIGDKTAASLLNQFGSIEGILSSLNDLKSVKTREAIEHHAEVLKVNKQLATLNISLSTGIDWQGIESRTIQKEELIKLLSELQFAKITERLTKLGIVAGPAKKEVVKPEKRIKQMPVNEIQAHLHPSAEIFVSYSEHENSIYLYQAHLGFLVQVGLVQEKDFVETTQVLASIPQLKVGWLLKPLFKKMKQLGQAVQSDWLDLSLSAYVLEPDAKIEWSYVRDKYLLEEFRLEPEKHHVSHLASLPQAYSILQPKIKELGLEFLLFQIEMPLLSVLCSMECAGIAIDLNALEEIKQVLQAQLENAEDRLTQLAGKKFNINSPTQTGEILKEMVLPAELTRTKTGLISTAEPQLIDLAPKYPFVSELLSYRKLNKVLTTYVYSLPKYVYQKTGKIHPVFQQMVAGTGRLSCTDPNLQNLPIKDEVGREVRKSIVPSNTSRSIVSIDYNQIELRLLAALSHDKVMIETFKAGKDIHTATACKIFSVSENAVTKEMRNKAKGVNFGIAYGITPWGLATRLKIPQKEAKEIIDAYFEEFSSIKNYLQQSVGESAKRGYSRTLYGRIRHIEGINSPNGTTRKVAERMAVNAPLQGLAADIVKLAMIKVEGFLQEHSLDTKLVLQVHDELVLDAVDEELDFLLPRVVEIMEHQPQIDVPLKVNLSVGKNWLELSSYGKVVTGMKN